MGIDSEYISELLFGSTHGQGFRALKASVSNEFVVECWPPNRF